MRVKFKHGKQREFLNEVLQNLACPSIKELINRGVDVNYSTLKNYFSEARLMSEDLYKELCSIARIDSKKFEVELVGDNWGQVRGGEKISLGSLKNAIKKSWDRDTCHFKFLWDDKDLSESAGHCRVVSLIINDYLGGEILHSYVKGNPKWDHYWNKLPSGKEIDLTKDQFPKNVKFVKAKLVSRKEVLSSQRTKKGYEILKRRVKSFI